MTPQAADPMAFVPPSRAFRKVSGGRCSGGADPPELARRCGITRMTVRKRRYRREVEDRSYCPQRLHITLTPEQEAIVVQAREVALLSRVMVKSGV